MPVDGLRQAPGPHLDFDRRDEERLSDFHHSLRMVGLECDRHRRHRDPDRVSGQLRDAIGDRRSRVRLNGWQGKHDGGDGHRARQEMKHERASGRRRLFRYSVRSA